jgi:NAD(P)H dehydrogenase (quinone)
MIVVAGVSGKTGGAAADALLNAGTPTRVIVRDDAKGASWRTRGADVAVAELTDSDALTAALKGASAAYLLVPPAYGAPDLIASQQKMIDSLAQAIRDSGVGHVVFLSSIGAQLSSGNGPIRSLHNAEEALRKTGVPLTILRAPYFVENWLTVLGAVTGRGVLPSFIPLERAIETAATADIGHAAATLLQQPPPSGVRLVEFAGPAPQSPAELAADLGRALGRPVQPIAAPLDQVVPTFTSAGFPESTALLFREMYEGLGNGRITYEDPKAPHLRGSIAPIDALKPHLNGPSTQ